MELRQAHRKQAKIKLALQGPAGSGKTMSALLLAFGLATDWNKIAIIDTENHSADLYAHMGDYNVLQLSKPYSPQRYIQALEVCEKAGVDVIIIDSISHEWEGAGGILDVHGAMAGNSFTNWSKLTPIHNSFVQRILESNCHIISTIRSKQDYVLSEKNGKMIPEKVGLKGITREGMDYEFTIVFDLDIKHFAKATKDRTGLFMDKMEEVITLETGRRIRDWCKSGISVDDVKQMVMSSSSVEDLRSIMKTYPEYRKDIEPIAIQRKEEINRQSVNPTKFSGNGTGQGK